MKKILCITNRKLCRDSFLDRIDSIARSGQADIVLREKDLEAAAYEELAAKVMAICKRHGASCILHTYADAAIALGQHAIHLPLPELRKMTPQQKRHFSIIGTSCHSEEEVREAGDLGCSYIIAGHIFETDCKRGLPGRGLSFLRAAVSKSSLPVYAIGGINSPKRAAAVMEAGAAGFCAMSGLMQCRDVKRYLQEIVQSQIADLKRKI